jgi:8-oxo-dGTP pyrophosphatase MutT (NUDIX family)
LGNALELKISEQSQFLRWKKRIEGHGNILKDVEILATISRDDVHWVGAFLDCRILTPEGAEIPRCVFLGSDAVAIVPVLTCKEDGETYTMMVEQRRIVDGGCVIEFPAGGVGGENNLKIVACRELKEELLLTVAPKELIPLAKKPLQVNPSSSGDLTYFFYFEREVSRNFLQEMDNRTAGCHEEHEYLQIKVMRMSEATNCLSVSALVGVKLLEMVLKRSF